jgi:hypothetical protein
MKTKHKIISFGLLVLMPNVVQAQTYGGFAVGKTFTLRVISKTTESYKAYPSWGTHTNLMKNIAVPEGIIDLSVGQTVSFSIAAKGALMYTGTWYGHGFGSGTTSQNTYFKNQNSGFYPAFVGYSDYYGLSTVGKNSYGTPTSARSSFTKYTPYGSLYQIVTYTFQ